MIAPAAPYRGIQPFRYEDHAIFFAREAEARRLARLVAVHRGVFLYGDSGNGKSSLINAGLLPQARRLGVEPVRVRVQPRAGAELVIEPIAISDDGADVPWLDADHDASSRTVLSIAELERRVRMASAEHRPLIVFDQFEEVLTLFDGADAATPRRELVEMIVRLLREPLPLKLLFAFREDYLGGVKGLLGERPELVDQALRLGPPSPDALMTIIRGPFLRFPPPEGFDHELGPGLAEQLGKALAERFGSGQVSLSEVQTVCLRLWRSADPDAMLAKKGVQGLLEDELGEALDAFEPDVRAAAVALLSQMVTSAGTRNVVSAEDLCARVREEEGQIPPDLLDDALDRQRESKLVRRERRRDLYLYEITSEFLVPRITAWREQLRLEQEHRRERRRIRIFASIAGALLLVVALVTATAIWALGQRSDARRQAANATSLALSASSAEPLATRPDVALGLAFEAYRERPRDEASSALVRALVAARRSRLRTVLTDASVVNKVAFSPDGTRLAAVYGSGVTTTGFLPVDNTVRVWDLAGGTRLRLTGHSSPVQAVTFSPDGTMLASVSLNDVRLWDPVTGSALAVLRDANVSAVSFGPDAHTLTSLESDGTLRAWDVRTRGSRLIQAPGSGQAPSAVAFSADGTTLAAVAAGGVTIRSLVTGRRVRLSGRDRTLDFLAFSPDGVTLAASSSQSGEISLWRTSSGERLAHFADPDVGAVAFSRDGRTLASADGSIRLWNLGGGQVARFRPLQGVVRRLQSRREDLASAFGDDEIRLWDASVQRPPDRLRGVADYVPAVAFSPDGTTLASAGQDGTVRLWNLATGRQSGALTGFAPHVTALDVAFSPDGRSLAAGGSEGGVRLWPEILWRSPRELHAGVCAVLLAGLTRSDWSRYAPGIAYRRTCP